MSLVLNLLFSMNIGLAADFPGCTAWKIERGVTCSFAGEDSKFWTRDCSQAAEEYQCRRGPGGQPPKQACLAETLCYDVSLDDLELDCSPWIVERGVKCGVDGKPKVWRRACQWEVVPKTACTSRRKSYPTEEDFIH